MRIAAVLGSMLLVTWAVTTSVRADIIVFKIPTTNLKFVLQGKSLASRTQPTVNFTHLNKMIFDLPKTADTDVIVMPPLNQIAGKRVVKAKGDEAGLRDAAAWSLDHGQFVEFHRAIDQLAALSPSDSFAVEAKRLTADLAKPLADPTPDEIKMVMAPGYKTVQSAHFLVGTPENEKPADKNEIKKKKPEARLEQLEQLLEVFVMKCAERGLPVQVPTTRLKVMLSPGIPPAAATPGARTNPILPRVMWAQEANVLFISHTNAPFPELDSLKKLQAMAVKASNAPRPKRNPNGQPGGAPAAGGGASVGGIDLTTLSVLQLSKLTIAMQALMAIGIDNLELEAISREAAYMFTANCDVVPPQTPYWVRDGLAAQFEFPAEMGWIKIGDVGHVRNAWYQASLQDPDRFTITDIVTGRCHENPAAMSAAETMRAGTLSWALVHFLLEANPEGLSNYLRSFRSMPPDLALEPDLLNSIFDEACSEDRTKLEDAWREHMAGLQAEYLILKDDEEASTSTTEN